MKRISLGCSSFLSVLSSFINSSSMCRRPAVSTRITSLAESFASLMAPRTISSGLSVPLPGQMGGADRFRNLGELFAGGGAVDVGGDDERAMAVVREPFGKLAGGGGLTGALQADDHPDRRRARSKERLGVLAEHGGELVANGLDDLLVGRKLQHDFAADGFLANVGEQFVGDADVDVAFEQGFANFGERGVEVLFGELALAAQILEGALKFFCQILKHELFPEALRL